MDKSTTERLSEYMIFRGINNNKITVAAGLSVGQIGKAIANNTGINSTSIEKILHTYPEISSEWLLTGKGEMLKKENEPHNILNEPGESYGLDYKELYLREKEIVDILKKQIIDLELQLGIKRNAG